MSDRGNSECIAPMALIEASLEGRAHDTGLLIRDGSIIFQGVAQTQHAKPLTL
jgi:hypothetical protein